MKPVFAFVVLAALSSTAVAELPAGHPGMMPVPSEAPQMTEIQRGKVLSVVETTGFTYIEVEQPSRTVWLAAPTVAVKKGDTVRFMDGPAMAEYHSKSLDRTFSNVIFVSEVIVEKAK